MDFVRDGGKKEVPVADRVIPRDRLQPPYGKAKVTKNFVVWSRIPSGLKANTDK